MRLPLEGFIVRLGAAEIICASEDEAISVAMKLDLRVRQEQERAEKNARRESNATPQPQPAPPSIVLGLAQRERVEKVLGLLRVLYTAGDEGIESDLLAKQAGLDGTRGLGGFAGHASKLLASYGFSLYDDLVDKAGTRWRPHKKRLREAIERLGGGL